MKLLRPRRSLLAVAVALSALSLPRDAGANGRFPAANQVATNAADPAQVLMRTTFGLLVSHDRGKTFDWVCEQLVGYGGVQDPGVAVFADGTLAAAAFEGLATSRDGGCSWSFATEKGLAGEYVIDVATLGTDPSRGVVVTSTGLGIGKFHVEVFWTADSGKTWQAAPTPLPDDILSETIDVAPSNPKRLYVSGTTTTKTGARLGVLATSADGGATWARNDFDLAGDQSVYVGGVDPVDDARVYLRTRGASDRLLVSADGGKTITEAFAIKGPMLGFAISPDGGTIALGGPEAGLLVTQKEPFAPKVVATKTTACLHWNADGLYMCGNDFADGFVLGRSKDAGATFEPLVPTLASIRGPLTTCAEGTPYKATCGPLWPALASLFGSGSAGAGGGGGSGGTAGVTSAPATPAGAGDDGGCGCAAPGRAPSGAAVGTLALLLLALRRRRSAGSR